MFVLILVVAGLTRDGHPAVTMVPGFKTVAGCNRAAAVATIRSRIENTTQASAYCLELK